MKVLVTGGAGFVGSHLVDGLLARGCDVRVLDTLEPQVHGPGGRRPDYLSPEAELVVASAGDRDAVRRALDDVEVVFHQAAVVGVGQSMYEIERYVAANTLATAVLLEAVVERRESIRKLVVASSMSIYGEGTYLDTDDARVYPGLRSEAQLAERRWDFADVRGEPLRPAPTHESKPLAPNSIYAVTKRDHEEMCLAVGAAYRIPTMALRYFNIYGTRQALSNPYTGVMAIFASSILNGHAPIVFEDGRQSRDFVHVSDIVQANLLALDHEGTDGRVYNVGTGRATAILEVAERLSESLGFDRPPRVEARYRAGDIRHCYADITRIQSELGYQPRVRLDEGIAELLEWLRTQRPEDRAEQARAELEKRGLAR